jgi:hypothetical protein
LVTIPTQSAEPVRHCVHDAIAGLILVPIMCWVFNLVAKLVGGLEFEVTEPEGA